MSEIRLKHSNQKVTKSGFGKFLRFKTNGQKTSGPQIAPKVFKIIHYAKLGKPYALLKIRYGVRKNNRRRRR